VSTPWRIASLAVAAAVVASCGANQASTPARPSAASPPASVSVTLADNSTPAQLQFTAKTVDGRDFNGPSLLGKPAVLWFWAPWCTTCQAEAPSVGRIAAAHPAVTFIGVAGLDQVSAMQQFVAKYPVGGFTNLADTDGLVWAKFGVTEQPAFAFIEPDGGITVVKGELSESDLNQRVAALPAA